jgi:hypothetical protein
MVPSVVPLDNALRARSPLSTGPRTIGIRVYWNRVLASSAGSPGSMRIRTARVLAAVVLWLPMAERLGAQRGPDHNWLTVLTPDSALTLRLLAGYRPRNNYGCWTRNDQLWERPGWRDLCVSIAHSPDASHLHLTDIQGTHTSVNGVCVADCTRYEDVRADTVEIGGRRVVAERGRASGGFEGMVRRRVVLVVIPLADGHTALLRGATGDDAGYEELLSVARTITEVKPP